MGDFATVQTDAYINVDPALIKNLCWWVVTWNVAVEFVAVLIPLDGIS